MEVVYTLWLRSIKRYVRSKSRLIGSLGMPFFFLAILGMGLNSLFTVPGYGKGYMAFITPGVVAMTILFTSMFSGIQVVWDKRFGFLKETLVAPVKRTEIMLGQTFGGATVALIQGLLILSLSYFLGVHFSLMSFLIALPYMVLTGISFTALGIAFASQMEDMHGFQLIINFIVFPVFFLSGALFPLEGLPSWLRNLALADPLTYGVEGMRFGLLGVSQISPVTSIVVLTSFSFATVLVGGFLFSRIRL